MTGGKLYSVANGDRGRVTVDGVEVKAIACCVGENGWAIVLRPDLLDKVGSFPELPRDEIPRVTMRGKVEFFPANGGE